MKRLRRRKKATEELVEQVEKRAESDREKVDVVGYLPTGCVVLNLALSDRADGGFGMGKIANVIGDSSSGKSILALSVFAECAHNDSFGDYRLIYDEPEQACEFDIEKLFGSVTADKIEPPGYDEEGLPLCSETVQDFHANVHKALDDGRPFVYILDSLDALDALEDQKKAEEMIKARERGTETAGTYGMAKPKAMSWILRHIVGRIKRTKSALIIISQTRDNISPVSFAKKTRSGGRALKFYCTHEMWLAVAESIKKKGREVGIKTKIRITKNKLTGRREDGIVIPIYREYGVDDIGASIDFLVGEGFWKKKGRKIDAVDLNLTMTRDKLIRVIEAKGLKPDLDKVVERSWKQLCDSLKLDRRPKYVR